MERAEAPLGVIYVRLAAELRCCVDYRRVATMTMPMLALVLTSSAAFLTLTASLRSGEQPLVCIGAIPLWSSTSQDPFPTDRSLDAQDALVGFLQAAQIAVLRPTTRETPLEELTALANANAASLSVAIRSLDADARCVALHVPPTPTKPDPAPIGHSLEDLRQEIRYADAVARATESQRVAALIAAAVPICPGTRDEAAEYFLSGSNGPAIVLELRPHGGSGKTPHRPESETLLRAVAGALGHYLAKAQQPHNKGMKLSKRSIL